MQSFAERSNGNAFPLTFVSGNEASNDTLEQTALHPGESAQVPVESRMLENYALITMDLSLVGLPPDVNAWIVPNIIPQNVHSAHPITNATIEIYADSNAKTGNYALKIIGRGLIKNQSTGEDIQAMNETLGLLYLTIMPQPREHSALKMDIGEPDVHRKELCIEDDSPFGGKSCLGFVGYEEFPITLSLDNHASGSSAKENISLALSAINVPEGVWLKFIPNHFNPSIRDGVATAKGKLLIAGAVKPFDNSPPDTSPIIIQATSQDQLSSITAIDYLPVARTGNLAILHSAGPLSFSPKAEIINNINGTNFGYYGAVYDPIDNDTDSKIITTTAGKGLPITLSVAGLAKMGKTGDGEEEREISPIPSWLKVDVPTPSFTLNATQPYYFIIKTTTSSAPVGKYAIVINETVGAEGGQDGQHLANHFIEHVPLAVWSPDYLGPAPSPNNDQTGDNNDSSKAKSNSTIITVQEGRQNVTGNTFQANNNNNTAQPLSQIGYCLSWSKEIQGTFTTVDISDDKSYVAVGTGSGDREGAIYLFSNNEKNGGDLLWNYSTDRRISSAIVSSDNSHLAAAGFQFSEGPAKAYINGAIYYFDAKTGRLLWNRTTGNEPVMWFSISSDGSHLAAGTNQNILYYDIAGRLVWNQTLGDGGLGGISMSPDGSFIFATTSDVGKPKNPYDEWGGYLLDGKNGEVIWNYTGKEAQSAGMPAISSDGKYISVGAALSAYNGFIYFFDRESGDLLWKHQVHSPVFSTSMSSDGSQIAVSTNWALLLYDGKTGNLLWNRNSTSTTLPNISNLEMTPDGRYVVGGVWGGGTGKDIQLFDREGNLLWSYPAGTVYSVDISGDGSTIAASASSTFQGDWQASPSTVYLFERQQQNGDVAATNGDGQDGNFGREPVVVDSWILPSVILPAGGVVAAAAAAIGSILLLKRFRSRIRSQVTRG